MKHILFFFLLLTSPLTAAIVNNIGSSGEDTLTVWVNCTDSIGNPTNCDSFFVLIAKSGTNSAIFTDSGTIALAGLDSLVVRGRTYYYFHRAVADIDGPGDPGVYAGAIVAKRNSGPLYTPNRFSFQIIGADLSDMADSAGLAARKAVAAIDSLKKSLDTVYAILDTLQARAGGSSGGNDSTQIARWVWNAPKSNHNTSGTFGKYLDTEISGLSSGGGAYAVTVVALDTTNDQVVPDVSLTVRNQDQSALIATGLTNTLGRTSFNLDPATYVLIARAPGIVFPAPRTLIVSGAGTDTICGYAFTPGTPSSPNLCRIYGFLYSISGSPEANASISACLPKGVSRAGSLVISPASVSTRSDVSGYFFLDLIPSAQLAPADTQYEISIARADGTILRKRFTIPSTTSWQLTW